MSRFSAIYLSIIIVAVVWAGGLPVARSQETQELVEAEFSQFNECLGLYSFGKVIVDLNSPAPGQIFAPGDMVTIAGTLENPTHTRLDGSRLFVRLLRKDEAVAEEHWHPIVAEHVVEDILLPASTATAHGLASFTTQWQIPAYAPQGQYSVEISLLAADGSPIAGVPYVSNVFGASSSFSVTDGGMPSAVLFDRSKVVFNGAPLAFRSVPPRPETGPLTIETILRSEAPNEVEISLEKSLYEWADVEGDTHVSTETELIKVTPGQEVPITFNWEAPTAGVYELILRAKPTEDHVLPSLMRIRFYYEGNVPRVLHVGVREEEDGSATAGACFFNSTFGPEGGSGKLQIKDGEKIIGEIEVADLAAVQFAQIEIPPDLAAGNFEVNVEASNVDGAVTDTEKITYQQTVTDNWGIWNRVWVRWVALAAVILLALMFLIYLIRRPRLYTEPL